MGRTGALVLLLGWLSSAAHAEPSQPFLTLDRLEESSAIGVGLSTLTFADDQLFSGAWRIDLYGRVARGRLTGYAQISWSHVSWREPQITPSVRLNEWTAASNLELGAAYVLRPRDHEVHLRAAFIVPTASELYYGANIGTIYSRLTDLAAMTPGAWWVRPGATVRGQAPGAGLFYQLDATLCMPLTAEEEGPHRPIFVLNLGAGKSIGPVQLTAELVNAVHPEVTIRSLAGTVAFRGERVVPYLGVVMPFVIGESLPAWAFSAGVHLRPWG